MPKLLHGLLAVRATCALTGRALSLALLTTLSTAASCQNVASRGVDGSLAIKSSPRLQDYVSIDRTISFPESPASSALEVYFDQAPGFLVADGTPTQPQIRAYDQDARLLWAVGQSGPGPREFQRLRSVVRNSSGDVIALDNAGRVSLWDRNGKWKQTYTTELTPTYNSVLINDSTLLISGRINGGSRSPLLHLFDLRRGRLTRSFFDVPPHPARFDDAYMFSGWANAAKLGGDTLGVIFALSDTLYLYRTNGTPISQRPLDLRYFLPLTEPGPRDDSPAAEVAWRSSYSRITQVFHAPDHSIYIQYGNFRGRERVWGLSRFEFTPQGTLDRTFEVPDAIRLLAISPRDGNLYFMNPESLEMVSWSVGHLLQR
jgi:hypothetical protein